MLRILRGLYLEYKIRTYEAKVTACTSARAKLKLKQMKYRDSYEEYVKKRKEM